jgi:hypothetical protein
MIEVAPLGWSVEGREAYLSSSRVVALPDFTAGEILRERYCGRDTAGELLRERYCG